MQPNQWQQQQFGYNPGFGTGGYGQQRPGGFMTSQPTGFPGAAQQQRPMATGMPGMGMQQGGAGVGGQGGGYSFLNAPPPPGSFGAQRGSFGGQGGMTPQMTGYPGGGGMMSQQTGFNPGLMSQPTGMGMGGGLMSQPTGMGLTGQPTGIHDARLGAMMQSFMPSNLSQPYSSAGVPQFNQTAQQPLTNTFQSLINNPQVKTPKVPWALSRQEKKDYDQIFRAWDTTGEGFISGEMARGVFGQSGLSQDDLMKIWNLSDVDNRGKLNLPEFHVAMGLIYRALNGNEIPDKLPEELVPASMRDIDSTVHFMRDLLKHEAGTRSDTSSPAFGGTPVSAASSKDAKMYKHDDSGKSGYKSSARHIDRKAVRYAGEDSSAEISDLRRQLETTSAMLDANNESNSRKTEEDEELEQEIDDVKYRVKRIQEDIDYVSKGRRTHEKDEERRKLEREMLFLMHEKLPELERRQERRDEEKRMEERAGVRARDKRNAVHGRYDDRDSDRGWLRGTYDRDSEYDRDRRGSRDSRDQYDRDRNDRNRDYRDRDRSRDRYDDRRRGSYERDGSGDRRDDRDRRDRREPERVPDLTGRREREDRERSEREKARASPAPKQETPKSASPAPPAPGATKPLSAMTKEERAAYVKEQAARRVQERMRALGVEPAASASDTDVTIEDRLAQEKREAEERAAAADREQEAREEARRQRLASARGETDAKDAKPETAKPAAPKAPPPKSAMKKAAPPPPVSRGKAAPPPPSPRKAVSVAATSAPPAPKAAAIDPEEEELRRQEEARQKAIAERRERLKRLQEEEEEERRKEEEILNARKARSAAPAAAPTPATTEPPASTGSFNPFHRKQSAQETASPMKSPVKGSFNPFFRPPPSQDSTPPGGAAPPPPPPPPPPAETSNNRSVPDAPPPPPAPPAPVPTQLRSNSAPPPDDDWDVIQEKEQEDSDSSDDEYATSRASRGALATALFGGVLNPGGSRPGSAGAGQSSPVAPANPAALAKLGGGAPTSGGMSALLSSIQGGARLRKAETVDKSAPPSTGRVIGDAAPPSHISDTPSTSNYESSPAHQQDEFAPRNDNRQSVDWYGALAADTTHPADSSYPAASYGEHALETTREEEERDTPRQQTPVAEPPTSQLDAVSIDDGPSLDDVDLNKMLRVRTLYNYETSFGGDLPFQENVVLEAHPAKDPNGPWWYGTLANGSAGWFPSSYVTEVNPEPCRALYDYSGATDEELSFSEGEQLAVVDQSEPDWWKVEKNGAIKLVPAAYVEVIGSNGTQAPAEIDWDRWKRELTPPGSIRATAGHGQEDTAIVSPSPVHARAPPHPTVAKEDELLRPRSDSSTSSGSIKGRRNAIRRRSSPRSLDASVITVDSHDTTPKKAERSGAAMVSPPAPPAPRERQEGSSPHASLSHISQYNDDDDSGSDSVLSFWSDSDEDPNEEIHSPTRGKIELPRGDLKRAQSSKASREERRLQREKTLAAAGLKIRREPPAVPGQAPRPKPSRRRAPPAVPPVAQVSMPVPVPTAQQTEKPEDAPPLPSKGKAEEQDAYARYEAFLSRPKSESSRPVSQITEGSTPSLDSTSPRPTSVVIQGPTLPARQPEPTGRFSGLFSKINLPNLSALAGPAVVEKERPRVSGPIISGPMGGAPIGSPTGPSEGTSATDGDFGKTWSSLVDASVTATMDNRERKRQEAIFEFIATESSYVRDLQIIVEVWYKALTEYLDDRALNDIFANVEDIMMFSTFFYSALEERQKACRLYVDTIGDVLAEHCQNLDVYMKYCVNQDTAAKLLVQLRSSRPEVARKLQEIRETVPAVRGLDLSSFLLEPMQRITRYPLLLRQIAQYTREDQDLGDVQRALASAERTTAKINEDVRESESRERLRVLSEDLWIGGEGRIDLTEPTQYQGARKLLKEGPVSKFKSGRRLSLVLCTDVAILIDVENGSLYKMPMPLYSLALEQGKDDVSFALVQGKEVTRLKAPSNRERVEWIGLITRARKETLQARRDSRTASMYSQYSQYSTTSGASRDSRYSQMSRPRQASTSTTPPIDFNLDTTYDDAHSYAGQRKSMYDHQF